MFSQSDPGPIDGSQPPDDPRLEEASRLTPDPVQESGNRPFRFEFTGLELAAVLAGHAALEVARDGGDQRSRVLPPPWTGDVDLARASHAVMVQESREGAPGLLSAWQVTRIVPEWPIARDSQELYGSRMGPHDVRHVTQSEPHLRRHVAARGPAEAC